MFNKKKELLQQLKRNKEVEVVIPFGAFRQGFIIENGKMYFDFSKIFGSDELFIQENLGFNTKSIKKITTELRFQITKYYPHNDTINYCGDD